MSSLLVINPLPSDGVDGYLDVLGRYFIDLYQKSHPEDEVEELRLYEISVPFLTRTMLKSLQLPDSKSVRDWVTQFKKYDRYLVLSPNWNLGVPSILKAYIDLIVLPGETYYFDKGVPIGLLEDKKVVLITSAAQSYNACSHEQTFVDTNTLYLKQIFTLMGVKSITHFGVEGIKTHPELVQPYLNVLRTQIERFVINF